MKQFHKTSYSKNKGSEDIVYRSVTGDYSISQEAFLDSDPALRAEDYAFFKRWSDENYRAEDSRDAKEARRVLPLEHISALGLPDKHVHRCPQSHTEHYRPYTALQMGLQVPAGEEQAAGQTHAVLLLEYIVTAPGPAEPGRLAYVPATELGLVSQVRSGLVRGTAHVT